MRRLSVFLFMMVIAAVLSHAADQPVTAQEQMNKLEPLVGKWKTLSFFTGKAEGIPGELEYRRVLGKNWLLVEFVGKHPEREYWEAYVMIKFDATKNAYVAYSFFGVDGPVIQTGSWVSEKTFRLEIRDEKGNSSGIDYNVKDDGTIYQENWLLDKDNQRQIRLKTVYTKIVD